MIEWNTVKYIDCMDEKEGLPSLPDKSVDLCLTDPPYNIKWNTHKELGIDYDDDVKNYDIWIQSWFKELKRISNKIILSCGRQNLKLWYFFTEPKALLYHVKTNGGWGGVISKFNNIEIYLCFGEIKAFFKSNTFTSSVASGWNKNRLTSIARFIHPCPKPMNMWNHIISHVNPESVIDPFMGSGTTAEVCTKLGIPWLGYEINEVYSQDIDKRLKNCKKEPIQIELML